MVRSGIGDVRRMGGPVEGFVGECSAVGNKAGEGVLWIVCSSCYTDVCLRDAEVCNISFWGLRRVSVFFSLAPFEEILCLYAGVRDGLLYCSCDFWRKAPGTGFSGS